MWKVSAIEWTAQGKDRISELEDKREEQGQSNKDKDKIVKRLPVGISRYI